MRASSSAKSRLRRDEGKGRREKKGDSRIVMQFVVGRTSKLVTAERNESRALVFSIILNGEAQSARGSSLLSGRIVSKRSPCKLTANDNREMDDPLRSRPEQKNLTKMREGGGASGRFLLRSLIKIINESRLLATVANQREWNERRRKREGRRRKRRRRIRTSYRSRKCFAAERGVK